MDSNSQKTSSPRKIVFLYTEIAEYFLAGLRTLEKRSNVEIHLFRWPVNEEAPFEFKIPEQVKVYEREDFDDEKLISTLNDIQPQLIITCGWMDRGYVKASREMYKQCRVVLAMDNQWEGSLKQHIARMVSPFTIKKTYHKAWIPGKKQEEYARKLGYKEADIYRNYYTCDFDFYHSFYKKYKADKKKDFPRRFIYVARYVEHKGIRDLWKAFIALQEEQPNDWELWCLGTGPLKKEEAKHPGIRHFGFVQPEEIEKYISQTGVYVLPSHIEPWGVALHEYASAGFPLISSDKVGAAEMFLKDGENGFSFSSGNVEELKNCMKRMIELKDEQLLNMGEVSIKLSEQVKPEVWADTVEEISKSKSFGQEE